MLNRFQNMAGAQSFARESIQYFLDAPARLQRWLSVKRLMKRRLDPWPHFLQFAFRLLARGEILVIEVRQQALEPLLFGRIQGGNGLQPFGEKRQRRTRR